jgi:hypothetical protein
MENQKTQQKKFFSLDGRKKKLVIVSLVILFIACIIGCRTSGARAIAYGQLMGAGNNISVVKDFEPISVVFAEATASRKNGYGTTYNALMKEAAQKGADAIINVSIAPTSGTFIRTWSGSALAIKYLDTVPGETPVIGRTPVMGEIAGPALLAHGAARHGGGRGFGRGRF